MKRHLNLMSNRACARECLRARLWQWSMVLATVAVLLVPTWFFFWWPVQREGHHVATLKAQYEPLRQMNRASNEFKKNIDHARAREKTALALATIDTPVVPLLGLVGKAVEESRGQVVIEKMDFQQSAPVFSEQDSEAIAVIAIEGQGIDKDSVNRLTKALKTALPFAEVQTSLKLVNVNEQQIQQFSIECTFCSNK